MADPKSKALKGGLNIAKRLLADEQPYVAGIHYADPLSPATTRLSEALGNVGAEGKTLNFTEADRSRVFGTNRGGVGFSGLQHYSEPHKQAGTSWGFGNKTTAEKKIRQNKPNESLWTTFVGAPDQHKSNTVVIQDAINDFHNAVKSGKVHPAQIKLMNERLRNLRDENSGALLFDQAFDLTDPQALSQATSFARRSGIGDVLLGEGVKGGMRRRAFKDEHGDQPWNNAGNMEALLKRETDPDLVNANTYDVGNRLFTMEGDIVHRPDLNIAFPWQTTGHDLGIKYELTPKEVAMRDWMKQYEGRLNKRGEPSPVSYMDLARNQPSQFVSEDYLKFLQKLGYKEGGEVNMAGGGGAFKRLEFTEDDNPVQVGIHANKMGENQNAGVMANLDMKSAGRLGVGSNISSRGSEMHPSTMVNYSNNVGDLGLNANVMKPMDAPNDVLMTNVMASYPVGSGRLTAGMHGSRMDGTHSVNAHSLGYNTPMSGGNLNLNLTKPKEGKPMVGAQFTRSFDTGGKVKAGAKVLKKLFSDDVLPLAEREENKRKFLDTSRIKDRLYHATPEDFNIFKAGGNDPTVSGKAIWMSADPTRQPAAHNTHNYFGSDPYKEGVNVMPVHVQAKNPMVLDDKGMIEWARDTFAGGSKEFPELMTPEWIDAVRKEGYDSIHFADPYDYGDPHEIIMFEPNKIKSAIGNRGTYDVKEHDITKARGGLLHMADAGRVVKTIGKIGKRLLSDEQVAGDAIGRAAESAGMKAPVTANKPLTDIQDFHTSLMDSVRARAMDAQKQMDSWNYRYEPGQYVFTEHGAKNNLPPLKILEKSRHGWNIVREDPTNPLSKKVIDPTTGKAQRTPYEPGYRVRREFSPEDWSEFVIPESAIKGDVEMARGGLAHMAPGGLLKGMAKVGKRLMADPADSSMISSGARKFGDQVGGNTIVKETGGNWLPSSDNIVRKSNLQHQLEGLTRNQGGINSENIRYHMALDEASGDTARKAQMEEALDRALKTEAANNWVNSNLSNYVTKQMGTEADPVRKLAEEGITAFPKNVDEYGDIELRDYGSYNAKQNRKETGYVPEGVGKSRLAKHYETLTDEAINPQKAQFYQSIRALPENQRPLGYPDMPWVDKLDPESRVYSLSREADFQKMGFDHIVDVLREDLATGRIRPEQLNKVSMEQAVRRAHQYDEELKAKMLNARIAEQTNAKVHKEYPEGYKWVQLDKPGQFTLESDVMGHSVRGYEPPEGHPDWSDISGNSGYGDYGHGGWEGIKSGQAKVYSLRDPKGMSHATVEVGQGAYTPLDIPKDIYPIYNQHMKDGITSHGGRIGAQEWMQHFYPDRYVAPSERITQIKGKQNSAPNQEYLPYVQDFVRSGQYSDVGDIANTGLKPLTHINEDTINKIGLKIPKYVTEQELKDLNDFIYNYKPEHGLPHEVPLPESIKKFRVEKTPPEGMANGGGAFKTIDWEPHFDGGGIAVADGSGYQQVPFTHTKKWNDIKRNAGNLWEEGKAQLEKEYQQLQSKGGKKDLAIRVGSQVLGAAPDLINLGLEGVDLVQEMIPSLSKPDSVLDSANSKNRIPKVKLASERPFMGSQHFMDKFKEAELLGDKEFPLMEIATGFASPLAEVALIKGATKAYRGAKALSNTK
jgi:hypothetical protein